MGCTFTIGYSQGLAQWILSIPGVAISLQLWQVRRTHDARAPLPPPAPAPLHLNVHSRSRGRSHRLLAGQAC